MKKSVVFLALLMFLFCSSANALFENVNNMLTTAPSSDEVVDAATPANTESAEDPVTAKLKETCNVYYQRAETYVKNNNMSMADSMLSLYRTTGCEDVVDMTTEEFKTNLGIK